MALQMEYTDEFGTTYPESYWKVVQTNMCQADKCGMVQLYGYVDAASKGKRIIGQKTYAIDKEAYELNFDADALNPEGKNPISAGYAHAKAMADVVMGRDVISFFEHAIDV